MVKVSDCDSENTGSNPVIRLFIFMKKKQFKKIQKFGTIEKKKEFYYFEGKLGKTILQNSFCDKQGNQFFRNKNTLFGPILEYTPFQTYISNYTLFSQNHIKVKNFRSLLKNKDSKKIKQPQNENPLFFDKNAFFSRRRGEKKWNVSSRGSIEGIVQKMNGCSVGYVLFLKLIGLGYKFSLYPSKGPFKNMILSIKAGWSHKVKFFIPPSLRIFLFPRNRLALWSVEEEIVSNLAYRIKKTRPPTPYKGKGIRFENETILLKEGKKNK